MKDLVQLMETGDPKPTTFKYFNLGFVGCTEVDDRTVPVFKVAGQEGLVVFDEVDLP